MFKSLRWRLQVWHAFVLLVVLTSFGAVVYDLQWKTRVQQIDTELSRIPNVIRLSGPTRGRRPRNRDNGRPDTGDSSRLDPNVIVPGDSRNSESGPAKPNSLSEMPRPPRERFNRSIDSIIEEFDEWLSHHDDDSRPYLVIWDEKGNVHSSDSAPMIEFPELQANPDGSPKQEIRDRYGDRLYRELIIARKNDAGTRNYLIGQSLDKELAGYHQRGWLLIALGLIILIAGTLVGGWLSSRAIRPIAEMTTAAELISAENLTQRISLKQTDSELGNLACVLNKTFDRLQSAFERQKQFTADASHELRTPLSVITTHTELALSRPRSNEDYRIAIETCQRAARRMRSLIDALLLLARFDSKAFSLKRDQQDLEPMIRECVELVRPLAIERRIEIEFCMTACEVFADGDRLSQVITNLLVNAIRYNVDAGRIVISNRIERQSVVIIVSDTGIGIAADQLTHIFDRFFQVDKARSRAEGSCGLGLSICKTIVEAHGGTISATSQSGVGTTIEIRLPCVSSSIPFERSESVPNDLVAVAPVS